MLNVYQVNGYANRMDYLRCMAEDFGMEMSVVLALADLLGENEDFDGFVTMLEDYSE